MKCIITGLYTCTGGMICAECSTNIHCSSFAMSHTPVLSFWLTWPSDTPARSCWGVCAVRRSGVVGNPMNDCTLPEKNEVEFKQRRGQDCMACSDRVSLGTYQSFSFPGPTRLLDRSNQVTSLTATRAYPGRTFHQAIYGETAAITGAEW